MNPTEHQLRVLIVAKWLNRYSAIYPMYGKLLGQERFQEFLDTFKDTSPNDLEYAFAKTRDEHVGEFPVPAEVMKRLRNREKDQDHFLAEKAWDALRWMIRTFGTEEGWIATFGAIEMPGRYVPYQEWLEVKPYNGGWMIKPKPFSRQMNLAIERVGGLERIRLLQPNEHDFVRRDFMEVFCRYQETAGYTQLPGKEEAKVLLANLKELAE